MLVVVYIMIIASCGHEISPKWLSDGKSSIQYIDYDHGQPVVIGAVVCPKCRKMYERKNLLLKNEQHRNDWLSKNRH